MNKVLYQIFIYSLKSEDTGSSFELPLCVLPGGVHLVMVMVLVMVIILMMSGLSECSSSLVSLLSHLFHLHLVCVSCRADVHGRINLEFNTNTDENACFINKLTSEHRS